MSDYHSSVFEFCYLASEKDKGKIDDATYIHHADFAYLEQRCLTVDNTGFYRIMQPRIKNGCKVLQVKNYVGVIFVPSGQHIEVLPKTGITDRDYNKARKTLLVMLQSLREFRHIQLESAGIDTLKLPLLEVFIRRFLTTVNQVVKRGLRSDYVAQQENLTTKRGKLNVGMQIKHNFVHKQRFYCEFDEYLHNRPINRLIKTAMLQIQRYSRDAHNQKLLRELLFYFDDVPVCVDTNVDFSKLKLDRGMNYYQPALAWTRLILNDLSPISMQGKAQAPSLLFPMEAVFESYVAFVLCQQLKEGYSLRSQSTKKSLVTHAGRKMFTLKPDLMIEYNGEPVCVLDSKWKHIDGSDRANNYGLSQADFYQMFAYGQKYLGGEGELVLVYPQTPFFLEPVESSFNFDDELRLWVVPFCIDSSGESCLLWPEKENLVDQFVSL
ncbi:restriction endonuclease [Vibrio albus]|uniref:Restriction endonuclease n=1 Tax=Vibrio albus TaxID=2200953 RepID=A0A2U3BD59_9VIBR|nr:McrC family protein [Vibrio albus]PWI34728.1 restriction endonuclease [Vibrio albus]